MRVITRHQTHWHLDLRLPSLRNYETLSFCWQIASNSLQPGGLQLQASLSFTVSQSLLRFMFIALVMLSNHLILCYPLLLLPSVFPENKYLAWFTQSIFVIAAQSKTNTFYIKNTVYNMILFIIFPLCPSLYAIHCFHKNKEISIIFYTYKKYKKVYLKSFYNFFILKKRWDLIFLF